MSDPFMHSPISLFLGGWPFGNNMADDSRDDIFSTFFSGFP